MSNESPSIRSRLVTPSRWTVAVGIVLAGVLASGCVQVSAAAVDTASPATQSDTPGPVASAALTTYSNDQIAFVYPVNWTAGNPQVANLVSRVVVELATIPVGTPCLSPCPPRAVLTPDTLIVDVQITGNSRLGSGPPFADQSPVVVNGVKSSFERRPGIPANRIDEVLHWSIPANDPQFYFEVYAYIQGPDLDELEAQVGAMVDSFVMK